MPTVEVHWTWQEAFDKFGFGDGDGLNMTDEVAGAIQAKWPELEVRCETWGMHNYMIMGIYDRASGASVYNKHPDEGGEWQVGYDDPEVYLPAKIVKFLNTTFADKPKRRKRNA